MINRIAIQIFKKKNIVRLLCNREENSIFSLDQDDVPGRRFNPDA